MKKLFLLAFLFLVGASASNLTVFAADYHTFSLSSEISYIKYREPGFMQDKGLMYGADGTYTYQHDNFLFRPELRFSYGQVDYKNSGTLENIDDSIVEGRVLFGYEFPVSTNTTLTPYIGLGYRYLNDDPSGRTTSDGSISYRRESNYLYSPIGMELMKPIGDKWSFGATLEYDLFWRGWQKSRLAAAIHGYSDLENTQRKGYGLRGSLKFLRSCEELDIIIEPFLRYWNIEKSDNDNLIYSGVVVGYGYEPKNNSTEGGLMVTCRWGSGRDRLRHRAYRKPFTQIKTEGKASVYTTSVNEGNYYESIRRDIALAVSEIKTAEKGNARVNITLSSEGRILALRVVDETSSLSDPLKKEITDSIYAVAPFPKIPPSTYKSEISFSVPILFE